MHTGVINKRRRSSVVFAVEFEYVCRHCGGRLELVEDENFVWLGCKSCMRYVKRGKKELVRRFVDYKNRRFLWASMVAELYGLYEAVATS
ncbi:MAG: hypothetical protein QXP31_11780 [Pyrobaculum sp.]